MHISNVKVREMLKLSWVEASTQALPSMTFLSFSFLTCKMGANLYIPYKRAVKTMK